MIESLTKNLLPLLIVALSGTSYARGHVVNWSVYNFSNNDVMVTSTLLFEDYITVQETRITPHTQSGSGDNNALAVKIDELRINGKDISECDGMVFGKTYDYIIINVKDKSCSAKAWSINDVR